MSAETSAAPSTLEWVAAHRSRVGLILIVLALVALVSGVLFWREGGRNTPPRPETKLGEDGKPVEVKLPEPAEGDKKLQKPEPYFAGAIWFFAAAAMGVSGALWMFSSSDDARSPASRVRVWLLIQGGALGASLVLLGLLLVWQFQDEAIAWANEGKRDGADKVFLALLITFVGLVTLTLSIRPARADERESADVRRAVYGAGTIQGGLILLILLALVNVVVQLKLPRTLDTTSSGFYTLDEASVRLLGSITEPVKAYLILPERMPGGEGARSLPSGRLPDEMRLMLEKCKDANPKFSYEHLFPSGDRAAIEKLQDRLKLATADREKLGVIVTAGEDESRVAFIPDDDLVDAQRAANRSGFTAKFQGESKLMTELAALTDRSGQPVVYFTQGHGEPSLEQGPGGGPGMSELRAYLTSRKFDVRPLTFAVGQRPTIDDGSLLVILAPTQPFSEIDAAVVRAFLQPEAIGKKQGGGKLLAFLPPFPGIQDPQIAPTGLEAVLREFGVRPEPDYLVNVTPVIRQRIPLTSALTVPSPELMAARHPIAGTLPREIWLEKARVVATDLPPQSPLKAKPLLVTSPQVPTWREPRFESARALTELAVQIATDADVRARKNASQRSQPVAVLVSDGGDPLSPAADKSGTPRLAVVGTGQFVTDEGLRVAPEQADVHLGMAVGMLDWLRNRTEAIGIKPKDYPTYTMDKTPSLIGLVFLPAVLIVGGTLAVSLGVWMVRRR